METITEQGKERLTKLIKFIQNLKPEQWNFASWDNHSCGTTCCAGGWCPTIWPNEWEWCESPRFLDNRYPYLKAITPLGPTVVHLGIFFGITYDTACAIFIPADDNDDYINARFYGIERPLGNCTNQQWVAFAIEVLNSLEVTNGKDN